jgi:hypothetical protein
MLAEQTVESPEHATNRPQGAPRILGRVDEYETMVRPCSLVGGVHDDAEVANVVSDDSAAFGSCDGKQMGIPQRTESRPFSHRLDIMTVAPQLVGHDGRVHLVEK